MLLEYNSPKCWLSPRNTFLQQDLRNAWKSISVAFQHAPNFCVECSGEYLQLKYRRAFKIYLETQVFCKQKHLCRCFFKNKAFYVCGWGLVKNFAKASTLRSAEIAKFSSASSHKPPNWPSTVFEKLVLDIKRYSFIKQNYLNLQPTIHHALKILWLSC